MISRVERGDGRCFFQSDRKICLGNNREKDKAKNSYDEVRTGERGEDRGAGKEDNLTLRTVTPSCGNSESDLGTKGGVKSQSREGRRPRKEKTKEKGHNAVVYERLPLSV